MRSFEDVTNVKKFLPSPGIEPETFCNFNYNYTFTYITSRVDHESFHPDRVLKQVVSMLKLTNFHEANRGFGSYRSILYIDVRIEEP